MTRRRGERDLIGVMAEMRAELIGRGITFDAAAWLAEDRDDEQSDADRSLERFRGILRERRQDAAAIARWADDGGRAP